MTAALSLRMAARIYGRRAAGWMLSRAGDELARLAHKPWREDPYPVYARMREHKPLYRSRTGMYAAASQSLCDAILRDPRFGVQLTDGRIAGAEALGFPPEYQPQPSFLELDPPEHTRLRALVRSSFTPRHTEGYREQVERIAHGLIDAALAKGNFDLMSDVAAPLPILVISNMLGVPDTDALRLARYGRVVGQALAGVGSLRQARELKQATDQIDDTFRRLINHLCDEPDDNILSDLIAASREGKLTMEEVLATGQLLLFSGFETTLNLIGNGLHVMLTDRDQWARLRDRPDLAPKAVEETLRYDPPIQLTQRIAHDDIELGGLTVRRKAVVLVLVAATGRDPAVYRQPDRFDFDRAETAHIAFGGGIHYCLGAALARLEAEVAFRALAERIPELCLGSPAQRGGSPVIRGLSTLPARSGRTGMRAVGR